MTTLTTNEWEEWGNPNTPKFFDYMLSYSPIDNVRPQRYPHIFQHFEKLYLSHEVGCRKPAPESFLSVCKLMQCPPSEVIFLDNTKENVAGAKAAGLTAYLTRSQSEVVETLRSL